jgi:preprotein translocase subunit SecE
VSDHPDKDGSSMAKDIVQFTREVKQEGQKVTWPTRKETITTTVVVFIMIGIFSVILMLSDWIISAAIEFILGLGTRI